MHICVWRLILTWFKTKWWAQRISCVHSQMLEVGNKCNGAVTCLIFYKGHLYSGYSDGLIKVCDLFFWTNCFLSFKGCHFSTGWWDADVLVQVWDIKGQTATLVQEMKEHRKAITCFALYEPGNCLLSGSADKTIKVVRIIHPFTVIWIHWISVWCIMFSNCSSVDVENAPEERQMHWSNTD